MIEACSIVFTETRDTVNLLIDTDIFWKLAVGQLLDDAMTLFGSDSDECGRLPALPYMLRRGRLRNKLGAVVCDGLISKAMAMPAIGQTDASWLDKLSHLTAIDPGEAQIYATAAATNDLIVLSSDKRALGALKSVSEYVEVLGNRIVILEAILLALCERLGVEEVRNRLQPLLTHEVMVRICFSDSNHDPCAALTSYYQSAVEDLDPLVLWQPL